ncbi:MAG: nicotinate-nucleotide adenylyltransferase [Gammaproteobacteria bacterium]|nr:nicotinate-nucleotide adenylyltransferase [Gammaproteobacteria bacterium]
MQAILGGTFDPVHRGHLHIAAAGRDLLEAESVTLMLSARPWHRATPMAATEHRWNMLRLAAQAAPGLVASNIEAQRPGPSYTADTLRESRRRIGNTEPLVWLIGEDAVALLSSWRDHDALPGLCHLLVFAREGGPRHVPDGFRLAQRPQELAELPCGGVHFADTPPMAVSSTEVRRAIATENDASALLPAAVWAYIRRHGLYAGVGGT